MLVFEQAKEIAVREIERLTSEPPLCDYEFGEMWFKREEEPFRVFAAASQEIQDEGYFQAQSTSWWISVMATSGAMKNRSSTTSHLPSVFHRNGNSFPFQRRGSQIPLNIGDQLWIVVISLGKQLQPLWQRRE